jgi:hypothetical protein
MVGVAACGGSADESVEQTPSTPVETQQPAERPATQTREPAPALSGESLAGEPVALADLRGRPVLINVWSSW